MGSTVNYGLNIPSGSDQVNILTQITPNFETIDEVMKDNEDAGIHVATELFSNNIHALTRTKGDAPAMRFTATSNYTAGDTFTVDGVQVTALAPNGETLPDNAYVIGCEVFAILKGMRLTVWAGSRATDSEKLNGEAASFYATKAEVDNAQSLAEGAATVAQNALEKIEHMGETVTGTVITNSVPSNTPTKVYSVSLDPGVYALEGFIRSGWSTGILAIALTTANAFSSLTDLLYLCDNVFPATTPYAHSVKVPKTIKVSSPTTINMFVAHSSGSDMSLSANIINVVRLS